jgi:DNA-binding response OmpR family regulator
MTVENATVLLVDDDYQIRLTIRVYLERRGYTVIEAADGQEAVEQAVARRPDIILLDVMMPVVDGHEALRRLKKIDATRDIPVLMLTAVNNKEAVYSSLAAGAGDYVIKGSIGISEICQRMERLLEKRKDQSADFLVSGNGGKSVPESEIVSAAREMGNPAIMPGRIKDILALVVRQDCSVHDWAKLFDTNTCLAETVSILAGLSGMNDDKEQEERPLTDIEPGRLRNLALGAAVLTSFYAFSSRILQRHLLGTAIMARNIAFDARICSPDEAIAAGMLHDFGKVLLNNRFPLQYRQVFNKSQEEHKSALMLERSLLGTDHAAFAAEVMQTWGVPPEFVEVVRLHHTPYKDIVERARYNPALIAAVEVADALDRIWDPGDGGDDCISAHVETAADALKINYKSLAAALDRALSQLDKTSAQIGDDHGKHAKLPEWAGGIRWKKITIAHARETGTILLEMLFRRCSVLVDHCTIEDAPNRAPACDAVLMRLSDESEIGPAVHACRKIRLFDDNKPICILPAFPMCSTDLFPDVKALPDPLSLSDLLKLAKAGKNGKTDKTPAHAKTPVPGKAKTTEKAEQQTSK